MELVTPDFLARLVVKSEESPLWRRPLEDGEWRHCVGEVRATLSRSGDAVFARLSEYVGQRIHELDPLMTAYCDVTCPSCSDRCCEGVKIFYNRTDLIYLAASGRLSVPGQTRAREGERCRYLGECGCGLSRSVRPYVCVWFLCEPQIGLLELASVRRQRAVAQTLLEIRQARLLLESLFEYYSPDAAVTPPAGPS